MPGILDDEMMYRAVVGHDSRFDGVFYYSANDSEVYCVPSCRVRTPLQRNVRFYLRREEAEADGRRPCMRCRPDMVPRRDIGDVWFRSECCRNRGKGGSRGVTPRAEITR